MAKVIGIGGVFFKCADPEATAAWYRDVLGVELNDYGGADFLHEAAAKRFGAAARTVWGPFNDGTDYFAPSEKPFMVNMIIDDLDAMLERLAEAGVELAGEPESYDYGRFAWIVDPDGVKVELWEPAGA